MSSDHTCHTKNFIISFFFWRNHNGTEVDIVFEGKNFFYALEIKANKTWKSEFNKGLNSFKERFETQLGNSKPLRLIGIYTTIQKQRSMTKKFIL